MTHVEPSTESIERYSFGYTTEFSNQKPTITAKQLCQRLQSQECAAS